MVKQAQHKQKWLHNREFLKTIDDDYPDWMVTVMFYAALHIVEALFANDETRTHSSHAARNETLKTVNRYQTIWRHYRPLHDAARTTRYDVNTDWIPTSDVKSILASYLYKVEASALKLIDSTEEPKPIW